MSGSPLSDLQVLILEDEPLVSMMTEDMVVDLGGTVVGPFSRLDALVRHIEAGGGCDLALLDVNVNGERSTTVADLLRARDIPIIFCTGYDDAGIGEAWRSAPRLRKPFSDAELEQAMRSALGR
ncbi:CheY chemotaxis protein or a CheY-like REC (receiver) domain [Devosia enhydra]|uniref:CheY chemotaxis protein or a CheY-like REC (Receiver) domain n=1 Tax=Devosia enhydra TaxID=665118 RepID=A0A1K2I1G7_9HYPH|nr:response regulator [Devosia enhydra]SFZ85604.1 CheY chemotaxis protein or a CheY-like REC (receiver) domain [Devosia enhydra]